MKKSTTLCATMTLSQFENGYWYATELKTFAEALGIPSARKLRKDELETAIKAFLSMGKRQLPTRRALDTSGGRDFDKGLRLGLPVENYTSNRDTKAFLLREAQRKVPGLKRKSGVSYRLNRWREKQLTDGKRITYGDLVDEFIRLNLSDEPFQRIPHGRYINFLADFLAKEPAATREKALAAWEQLKKLDVPKDYASWKRATRRR